MESPKLPGAVFAYEAPDDRVTTRMLMNKICTIVDNFIDNYPDPAVILVFVKPL
jgi:hypothetical protein